MTRWRVRWCLNSRVGWLLMAAAPAALAACSGNERTPAAEAAASAPMRLRGTLLTRDSTTLAFVACGTTVERPVDAPEASRVREAFAAVTGGMRDSAFLELDADTAAGRVLARAVRFAANLREGSRCDLPHPMFDLEAIGTEPYWHVTLDGSMLVLERAEAPLELAFEAEPPVVRGELTTIMARRPQGRVRELQLGVLRTACRDGMSDSWYPYSAEVRFGDLALHGCARR